MLNTTTVVTLFITAAAERGWNDVSDKGVIGALATCNRDYRHACGGQTATVFLYAGESHFCLDGHYTSEGQNVLKSASAADQLIPRTATAEQAAGMIERYIDASMRAINNTYAMRLSAGR